MGTGPLADYGPQSLRDSDVKNRIADASLDVF